MYSIVLLVLMFALLYFFMIRPENKRKKQAQAMRDSLTVGDEITTIGGIIGTICAVKENTIVIETGADRVRIEFRDHEVKDSVPCFRAAVPWGRNDRHDKHPSRIRFHTWNLRGGCFL